MKIAAFIAGFWVCFFAAACATTPRTRVTISKDEARVETRGEVAKPAIVSRAADGALTVTTPTTPEPPAPETSAHKARTRAQVIYRLAAVLGVAAFLFGLIRDYQFVWIGGAVTAAAALAGYWFAGVSPAVLNAIIGAGLAFGLAGAFCWLFKLRGKIQNSST